MKKLYYLSALCLIIVAVNACQNGKGNVTPDPSALIVGKWELQQQKTVLYINNVSAKDTTIIASPNNISDVQFNKNGRFTSAGYFYFDLWGPNHPGPTSQDTSYGTYSVANTALQLSSPVAGFVGGLTSFNNAVSPLASLTLISNTSQIKELTSSKLTFHTEYIYSKSVNAADTTYKNEIDYYYTK